MAIGDPYITADNLKEYAQIPDIDDVDDVLLAQVVSAVSRNIERHCGRQFNKATVATARQYFARSAAAVDVDEFHTTDGLIVATGPSGTFSTTLTDFTLHPLNGIIDGVPGFPFREIILHSGGFAHGDRPTVQVTAKWGWNAVPSDVTQAALIQCARIFNRRHSIAGLVGQGDFVFRVSSMPMDPDAAELLRPYRRPQVA
jgi:hypothetical protein